MARAQGDGQESLSEAFWQVARLLRHSSRESLSAWEVTPSQARALRVLHHDGPIRLNELSERLGIAPRSTTEVVDGLEERGLARRTADSHDRRATLVELTAEGLSVVSAIKTDRAAQGDALFAQLTASERTELGRLLRKLQP